jgi:hypothetical protein
LLPREEVEAGIWAMFSVIAARNMTTLLTIVEKSSAIIANSKGILSRSVPLVLKTGKYRSFQRWYLKAHL